MAMDAMLRISNDIGGVWDIPCKCKRPSFDTERMYEFGNPNEIKSLNGMWLPLVVELFDLTAEQELYLRELSETYNSAKIIGRNNYALGHKKDIEIRMTEEVWNLQGCYIIEFDNNITTIKFDRASLRY